MTDLIDPPEQRPSTATSTPASSPLSPAEAENDGGGSRRRGGSTARTWWDDGFRPLLQRLHFTVGVFVGPFILVAAISGLLYTLTPAMEQVVHSRELSVPVGTTTVPVAEQVAAGQAAVPEGTLVEFRPPRSPDGTSRVVFESPEVDADHTRTAFVDPYTGEVRGVLATFGEWLPLRSWFDALHRTLLLGDVGRVYSELAASWLWVLALSGVGIWAVRTRRKRGVARRILAPQTGGSQRSRLRSWHGAVGVWAVVGLLFLSATGLTWSQFAGANFSSLTAQLDWSAPSPTASLPGGSPTDAVPAAQQGEAVARVLETGREAGLSGPVAVNPGGAGEPWTVAQVKRSWPEKHDALAVDPFTGQVLDRVDFAEWPFVAKLAQWGVDAHMGLLFGVVNIVILAVLALGIICLVVWGYRMWWLRRPTGHSARATTGRRYAAPLGAGRSPTEVAVATVAGLAVIVSVAFPVLGGSLLLFLALDAAVQTIRHRRGLQRAEPPATFSARGADGDADAGHRRTGVSE